MIYRNWIMLCLVTALGANVAAAPLDDRLEAFNRSITAPTESQVAEILNLGVQSGRSAEAIAGVQAWLNRNTPTTPAALAQAGQAAEYAGQWLAAVGYYQTLLQEAKVDPKLAGPAVDAVYRLLLNALADENAAYLYARKRGNAIRSFGDARRYDRWFLDKARQQRDLVAVAERLTAIVGDKASKPNDFAEEFDWLCSQIEAFGKESDAVYESARRLAAAARTPATFAARLNWVVAVMPYNQKLDALRNANAPADAKLTDAPLAAAAQLIKTLPDRGPILVAAGWGTEYDHQQSGNCARRFEVDAKRKLDQLLAAVPNMSADKRGDLLAFPIAQGRVKLDPLAVRELVLKYPGMLNSMTAADVLLFDKDSTTIEDAKKLAPLVARSPHAQAALIRAIAASGSLEFGAMARAMLATEAWRFDQAKSVIDLAWRNAAAKEIEYNQLQKEIKGLGDRYEKLRKQIGKQADARQRLAAFEALRDDLHAKAPSIPGGLALWDDLFAQAPDADGIAMLKTLMADNAADHDVLLRRASDKVTFGRNGRMPWRAVPHYNQFKYHRSPSTKAAAELIAHMQGLLENQMKAGAINQTIFGMWLHTVDPSDAAARQFVRALAGSSAFAKLDQAYRDAAADRYHFGSLAIAPADVAVRSDRVSRELLALKANADAAAVEAALASAIKRAQASPQPVAVIGLARVANLPKWSQATRRNVLSLFKENVPRGGYPDRQGYEQLIARVCKEFASARQWGRIEPYLAGLWTAASATDDGRYYRGAASLIAYAEAAMAAEAQSVALSVARSGVASQAVAQMAARRDTYDLPKLISRLGRAQGQASIALGIIDIPVDERDATYPIYKSQAEFAMGNIDSAWELYDKHADRLLPIVRELTVPYCLWVLERDLAAQRTDQAEAMVRELTVWSQQEAGSFTPKQEGELKISYADAAFQKGSLQTARAWYRRVADAAEYRGTALQYEAILRSVRVDRAEKNFSSALAELDKLMLVRDENLRLRVHFARAQVLFDQENYGEAFTEVSLILKRNPDHPDALILLGQAQLKMRKLVDASEIELGVSRDQKMIVPGEAIKINLSDPALNISGLGADIEVEIWTKSGDRERVKLHQLGDDKTRFRAEVPTKLAACVVGDKVLQVLGRDEIQYGYSKRFREKMKDLPDDPKVIIGVGSDAHLAASAGAFPPRAGERKLNLEELGVSTAQQALGTRSVRPGNPVYIRVTDPDQSKTDKEDQVVVSVQASNGDIIPRLVLKETGPFTGEFEAAVPTAGAQPLAYASESAPGRDPNMVISANDYPGWVGEVGSKAAEQSFMVDLNDNVPLGKMIIACRDAGLAPTRFIVQTSMNGRAWDTLARFPDNLAPWDGRPQITAFPTYGRNVLPIAGAEDRLVPTDWSYKMDIVSARKDVSYGAFTVKNITGLNVDLPSGGHPAYSVLIRYRALFYQPAAAIRTFKLTGLPSEGTIFLVDGKPADAESESALEITRQLKPGLHEIEIWRHESRAELLKRKPRLMQNVEGQAALEPCADSMFDPATFPEGVRGLVPGATQITRTAESPDQFEIAFGQNIRGRLVRLMIVEHRGAAPAIHKITLTDRAGASRLPVGMDYQQLRANEQLEVVPGDQVSVRYEDDRTLSERRNISQARLTVAYNTARISASFLNYITTEEGRELVLEPIRRFDFDEHDSVGIVVEDPDMDQTAEPDELEIRVKSSNGTSATLEGLETGPHTGVFIGRVFPVEGKPKRESELQVEEGGTITAYYRDAENLDPGIPTDRAVVIEHAKYNQPKLAIYDVGSKSLPGWSADPDPAVDAKEEDRGPELVAARRVLSFDYKDDQAIAQAPPEVVIGSTLRFDVQATYLAFAGSSEVIAYVQTQSGRDAFKARGGEAGVMPFDVNVPGTLKLVANPSRIAGVAAPAGYDLGTGPVPPSNRPALDEGRFAFSIPVALGTTPDRSFANEKAESLRSSMIPDTLAVRPGDRVYIGFAYFDKQGEPQWLTATVKLSSHAFLDVMNSRYRRDIAAAFVGEKLYIRLIDPARDTTEDRDELTVQLKADSGATVKYPLRESEVHSGVFKGSFALSYADQPLAQGQALPSVTLHGLPVKYGDRLTVSYSTDQAEGPPARHVAVNKGADGGIEPFSKRYGEDAVAIQTTFTMAECLFELAKHHRKMDQESLARREMGQAQKLLAEAIASHRDADMQAHAEYLLANLAQEYADLSKNETLKLQMYQDALARFSKIPLDYPDTEFAPKAQFKKALVYERLGEVDIAVEEYVKLAYKYPEHELIPSVMSRLGAYFQAQGKSYKDEAEALAKLEDDIEAQGKAIALRDKARKEYLNAATVFKKLQDRFPNDVLAGLAGLRSAQNYMRAEDFKQAIDGFQKVVDTEEYDDRTIRSQAIYWQGISCERLSDHRKAYELYRRTTFDFPDSTWAKRARGRLADPVFADIIKKEELARERMLEALKEQRR